MTQELHYYLQKEWMKNNHPKYHKYFEEWVVNITPNQIHYFTYLWMLKQPPPLTGFFK